MVGPTTYGWRISNSVPAMNVTHRRWCTRRHTLLSRRTLAHIVAPLLIAGLPAGALAAVVADPAKQVPRPPEGAWKLTPVSSPSELISAGFTLSGPTVSDLHGKLRAMRGCSGGNFTVNGTFKIATVTFTGGVRQWTVGSGRNSSGGLAARSVVLQINGHKQDDATLTVAFPGSGQKGAGELNWGIQQTPGISPCTTEYYVRHG